MLTAWRQRLRALLGTGGGFDAALGHRRLRGFQPARAHVNTLLQAAGPEMNARARWLVRNNGYASNALESFAANVVGEGIKPSARIDDPSLKARAQDLWFAWTDQADAEGFTDFYGLQRRVAREVFLAGEVFLRFRPRRPLDGLVVPLQLQMLPSEMMPIGKNETAPNGNEIRQGIEFDGIGRRVAYHFHRRHPQDAGGTPKNGTETVRVPASEVLHVIDPVEAGQLRGVSKFAPAIIKLFLLDQYDDAELDRKKVAAMYALFVTSPSPDGAAVASDDDPPEIAPGQIVRLAPGDDVRVADPAESGSTYEPFQYRTLLQIASALGVPYPFVTQDMVRGNFSNSRLALMEFRRRIQAFQHSVLVFLMCRPVWTRWLDTAVLAGALDLPGYDRDPARWRMADWLPTRWSWVDPLKDINAEIAEIEAGLKSRTQAVSERGYDVEQLDREIAAERARAARLGLDFRRPGSPAAPPEDVEGPEIDMDEDGD